MDNPIFKTVESIISLTASAITIVGGICCVVAFLQKHQNARSFVTDILRLVFWLLTRIVPVCTAAVIVWKDRTSILPAMGYMVSAVFFSYDYIFDSDGFAESNRRLHRFIGVGVVWLLLVAAMSISFAMFDATQKAFDAQQAELNSVKKSVTESSHKVP